MTLPSPAWCGFLVDIAPIFSHYQAATNVSFSHTTCANDTSLGCCPEIFYGEIPTQDDYPPTLTEETQRTEVPTNKLVRLKSRLNVKHNLSRIQFFLLWTQSLQIWPISTKVNKTLENMSSPNPTADSRTPPPNNESNADWSYKRTE